jgi:hypothetical protein
MSKRTPQQFFDYYVYGGLNTQGIIKSVWDIEAIKNSIIMWLGSFRGEYLDNPTAGGYLTQHLMKPMTESRTQSIRLSLFQGFEQDFSPSLRVNKIDVIPNFSDRFYEIIVEGFSPAVAASFSVGEKFRNFSR